MRGNLAVAVIPQHAKGMMSIIAKSLLLRIALLKSFDEADYDCVVIAVAHDKFKGLKFSKALVYDIKNIYENADARL